MKMLLSEKVMLKRGKIRDGVHDLARLVLVELGDTANL